MGKIKNLLYAAAALIMLVGCAEKPHDYYIDELVIDTANCLSEGSYVQGSSLSTNCSITIPYVNGKGGTAEIHAPESNGMRIDKVPLPVENGSGEFHARVQGIPLELKITYLQLHVEYQGQDYISSVEVSVIEDTDPTGEIIFDIALDDVIGLTENKTIPFTVTPTMSSVLCTEEIEGLRVQIISNPATGEGTVTLIPSAAFIGGTIKLSAEFGAKEPQKREIKANAFAQGEGTAESPFVVASASSLEKVSFAPAAHFTLSEDIVLGAAWAPLCSAEKPFVGVLEGAGHSVVLEMNTPEMDNVALFHTIDAGAVVRNMTLKGSVVGRNYVAALASSSAVAIESSVDVSAVTVRGANNIAAAVASGAGKDAAVISYGTIASAVNIMMGSTSATGKLGLNSTGVEVVFIPASTGTTWSYDGATDTFTVTKGADFAAGAVEFYAKIGDNVTSTSHSISVTSKNMYEGGTGTLEDPYIVADSDQLAGTMTTYPDAAIALSGDMTLEGTWTSVPTFTGVLDGAGHTLTGLNAPLVATLKGTVKNLKLAGVEIVALKTNTGVVACLCDGGVVEGVGVKGTLTAASGASSGDTGLAGIAGQAQGASVINNCYVNLEIATNNNYAVGGLVGVIKGTNNVTMSSSTIEGSVSSNAAVTKIGGVLGRKTNTNQNSKDIITGCLVTTKIAITGTGSNMVGGVFGALQGATVSGDYCGGLTIEKTAFMGSVSAGNAVGGIGGVCCSVRDCFMGGSVQATNVLSGSTSPAAGISSAVKGNVDRCVVVGARITGGAKGTAAYTAGIAGQKNGNNPTIKNCAVISTTIQVGGYAIYGAASADCVASDNYRWGVKYADESAYIPLSVDTYGQDGIEAAPTQVLFEGMGYDFTDVWSWNAAGYPELKNVGCGSNVKIN